MSRGSDENRKAGKPQSASPWEWAVAFLGLVLIVGIVGDLIRVALTREGTGAIAAEAVETLPAANGHVVRVAVANRSGRAGAQVQVVGELRDGERVVETASAVLDYVAPHSVGHVALVFRRDPRALALQVQVRGYAEP